MEKEGTQAKCLKPTRVEVPYGHNTGWMQMERCKARINWMERTGFVPSNGMWQSCTKTGAEKSHAQSRM